VSASLLSERVLVPKEPKLREVREVNVSLDWRALRNALERTPFIVDSRPVQALGRDRGWKTGLEPATARSTIAYERQAELARNPMILSILDVSSCVFKRFHWQSRKCIICRIFRKFERCCAEFSARVGGKLLRG
jgi:hypothetical protein